MQIKQQDTTTLLEWPKRRLLTMPNDKDVEQQNLFIARGNSEWYFGRQPGSFSRKIPSHF